MGMKFIRGMIYPNANGSGLGFAWRLKWAYEFWGFCVNGTSSLTVPGGFAANNGVSMPTNFTAGTSLMASGSDGSHPVVTGNLFSGDCVFTAQSTTPFTPSMVGKALVIWKAGSNSSEDSIYVITQYISSNQILININTGGTPNVTTKHPSMTSRTSVNYRVVDMVTGAAFTGMNGSFLVLETDASSINPGQANSQIQFVNLGIDNSSSIGVGLSGTGSWNGTAISISGATNATPIVVTSATHSFANGQSVTINGVTGNTATNGNWIVTVITPTTFSLNGSVGNGTYTGPSGTAYNGFQVDGYTAIYSQATATVGGFTAGQTAVTCIADKTFFINHIREQDVANNNFQSNWHFEIPKRLYPQNQDLHPIAILIQSGPNGINSSTNSLMTTSTTASYGGGWVMRTHSSDTVTARSYRTLVKAMRGDGTTYNGVNERDVFGEKLTDFRITFNSIDGTLPTSDGVLCLPGIANQYCLARVKLRTVKFTGTSVPKHHRIGLNGEWIQMRDSIAPNISNFNISVATNGIAWPWDNTIIPTQLLIFGS